jgi:hypothetical protein
MNTLQHLFPNCVICGNLDIPWPARLLDLRAYDFFLWGYLKNKVFSAPPPQKIPELKHRIQEDVTRIPVQMLCSVMNSAHTILEECVSRNRGHLQDMRHEKKSPVGNKLNALICSPELCTNS